MTKYIFTVSAVLAFIIGTLGGAKEASAQGFHFGGAGVHVDVGYPHSYGGYPYTTYWGNGWSGWGGHTWHDTTHYDYHPGGFRRHNNHYHYVPGHYDVHYDGHWDHHHF
jgi:hypothetical protein